MDTDTTHGTVTVRELELASRWQETLARADKIHSKMTAMIRV